MAHRDITTREPTLLGQAEDDFDRRFWDQMAPIDRLVEAWRMTEEVWQLKGWDPGEPGLSRSVARVIRG